MNFVTPAGFRDVLAEEACLREEMGHSVQMGFARRGYMPIETPTLEVMDVMEAGGRIPGAPFKLFDAQGDLLAMRPDVTLQVARMCATRLKDEAGPFKFRYTQRVFRETDTQASARELTQIGIESIGESGPASDAELVGLFAEALNTCKVENFTLALGTVSVLRALLEKCQAPSSWKHAVLKAYHASNFVELDALVAAAAVPPQFSAAIKALPRIRGGRAAIEAARALVAPLGCAGGLDAFEKTYDYLVQEGLASCILVDFSVMSSFDYYTGIVIEAYVPGLGAPVGSGGRYDTMLAAYGQNRPAAGFAFYLEQVMAAAAPAAAPAPAAPAAERPLRIAVPKGSLNADTLAALARAGLDTTGLKDSGRQLIIRNPGVEYIIVRPTDAPVFVALGAADCGICGKDSLLEAECDVVELVDLRFGACQFIVAEPADAAHVAAAHYRKLGSIRVATKYPRITKAYYASIGVQVEIVKLHGNIELAPLCGMAERIVDITATGTTLRENNLIVVDEVLASTARFFANTCAFRLDKRIGSLAQSLQKLTKE
ncbi:MAG: ATP phosphoribosyltransferase [Raoultibacter sp.]